MISRDKHRPIICHHCGSNTGFTWQGLSMYVLPNGGLVCKNCNKVFLEKRQASLTAGAHD